MSQTSDGSVAEFTKALRDGNAEPLERLSIAAGYTTEYSGWRSLEGARTRLSSSLSSKDPATILVALDAFCGAVMPAAYPAITGNEYGGREQFGIPASDEMSGLSPEAVLKLAQKYLGTVERFTGPVWANKEAYFIRTKEGPKPFRNSMVACVAWTSKGKDSAYTKPENRRFFIDVFDGDPLWEMKLDWGVYTSIAVLHN